MFALIIAFITLGDEHGVLEQRYNSRDACEVALEEAESLLSMAQGDHYPPVWKAWAASCVYDPQRRVSM